VSPIEDDPIMAKQSMRLNPRPSLRKSVVTSPRMILHVGRNDPCPCGSGEKYKNCCIAKGDVFLRKMAAKKAKEDAKALRGANKL
jgi:hypothetical protein